MTHRIAHVPTLASFLTALVLVSACSSSDSDSSSPFQVRSTSESVAGGTVAAFASRNSAFLADESTTDAGGTDLNGDLDLIDSVAVFLDLGANTETVLGVAAQELYWITNELYLVTDEALDANDWNNDADMTDVVLLHWSKTAAMVAFVDTVATGPAPRALAIGTNLFYSSATVPAGAMMSNLHVVSTSAPLATTPIPTTDMTDDLSPRILGEEEGLIFLALDETVEGRDLNGDADTADGFVLALVDGTNALGVLRNTERALPSASAPRRAKEIGSHNWQVGFLVSEAGQGNTNLNDPTLFGGAWKPNQCIGDEDADTTDDVLHFLQFANWNVNPVTSPVRNTGLVGGTRIAIANSFIAVNSPESAEGTCDLNNDGDTADVVVRWTQILADPQPILPLNSSTNIHALFDVPGGTHGIAEVDNRFVIVVSENAENQDINGDTFETFNLVGMLSPSVSATAWDFTHSTNGSYVGASWMAETEDRTRLGVALEERVGGVSINTGNASVPGDADILDSVPTFADVTGSPTALSFPGVAIAVDEDNAGIIILRNFAFYRVDEVEDNRDWNGDGDETDVVLWRTDISRGTSTFMGVLNVLAQPAVLANTDESSQYGAAFLADEAMDGPTGTDLNADGDSLDLVLRYFRF